MPSGIAARGNLPYWARSDAAKILYGYFEIPAPRDNPVPAHAAVNPLARSSRKATTPASEVASFSSRLKPGNRTDVVASKP